jgi:hypothetical protein
MPVFKLDPLGSGAGVNVLSLMLFPDPKDEPRRIQFNHYVDQHELALRQAAETGIPSSAILETALAKQFDEYISLALLHGRTVGELVVAIRALATHHPEHGEASISKAAWIVAQRNKKNRFKTCRGKKAPTDENHIRKRLWSKYRSVSHLWAAGIFSGFDYLQIADDDSKDLLLQFLGAAEDWRSFSAQYTTRHQINGMPQPILPEAESWKIEVLPPAPKVSLIVDPLPPELLEILGHYESRSQRVF